MNPSPTPNQTAGKLFVDAPVVAVIRIESAEQAVDLAQTLLSNGVKALEITLRTAAAIDAIRRIREALPDALVGAGTVLDATDLARVENAGARFAIAPGATDELYRAARNVELPLITGVATASELMLGLAHGHRYFKLFPAEAVGGLPLLKSFLGPFPQARFIPTGGITPANAPDYLAQPNVIAVGGSWMVPEAAMAGQDWGRIAELARQCGALTQGLSR